jgi:hypothetical protein
LCKTSFFWINGPHQASETQHNKQKILLFCVGQFWFTRISIVLVLSVGILLSLPPFLEFVRHWRPWLADLRAPILPLAIILVVLLVTAIGGKVIIEPTTLWASLKVPQGRPFDVQPEPH